MTLALPEPTDLAAMRARKRAADARIAEAARRHRERRAVAARRPEPETPPSEPEPASPFAAQVAADPSARAILDHARHARMRREIIANVAAQHGVTPADIIGSSRLRTIVRARQDAIAAVASAYPHLSAPALGRAFGDRDHTTILHALRARLGPDYPPALARAGCS